MKACRRQLNVGDKVNPSQSQLVEKSFSRDAGINGRSRSLHSKSN